VTADFSAVFVSVTFLNISFELCGFYVPILHPLSVLLRLCMSSWKRRSDAESNVEIWLTAVHTTLHRAET